MIQVNLLSSEERQQAPRFAVHLPQKGSWLLLGLGIAVVLPLAGVTVMQQAKVASLNRDIRKAEEETRRLKPQIEKIQVLTRERADINQRLITVQGLARDRYLPVQVMDELAAQTPDHLWFTKFSQKPTGDLELEGMTFSNILVAELMTRMEEADIFQDVSLLISERAKVGEGRVLQFTLNTKVKP